MRGVYRENVELGVCRDCVESRAMKPKGCDSGLGKVHCVHILSMPALASRWSALQQCENLSS